VIVHQFDAGDVLGCNDEALALPVIGDAAPQMHHAILDDDVMPAQYELTRIRNKDVQDLLRRVSVSANQVYSQRFPEEMPCRIQVVLRDGQTLVKESRDYPGFVSQPMSWEMAIGKFNLLTAPYTTAADRNAIAGAIADLENTRVRDLMQLLTSIHAPLTAGKS